MEELNPIPRIISLGLPVINYRNVAYLVELIGRRGLVGDYERPLNVKCGIITKRNACIKREKFF